ncbi:MAG: acyl-ACP--UDP-N-acetylglucosamine O-acyltransferase [Acidobacteriota bacterium]
MTKNKIKIHPTTVIGKNVKIEDGVEIGPYTVIGENVRIGKNTRIESNVFIEKNSIIGEDNHIFPYVALGKDPQDLKYKGEETFIKIGNSNRIREFVTIHRGTSEGGTTTIGNGNYIMAYSHIAHDCKVGNETIFVNGATLAGHVEVYDFATIGAFTGVHQFTRIGKYSYIGGYSVITQDVVPFSRVVGARPTYMLGLNSIGMRRRGFSRDSLEVLKNTFKFLFFSDLNTTQAIQKIENELEKTEEVRELIDFINSSKRGIIKKISLEWEEELV